MLKNLHCPQTLLINIHAHNTHNTQQHKTHRFFSSTSAIAIALKLHFFLINNRIKMLLKSSVSSGSHFRHLCSFSSDFGGFHGGSGGGGAVRLAKRNVGGGGLVINAAKEGSSGAILDVIFKPFEEVKKELLLVPSVPEASLARHKFCNECEAAINDQINVEYNVSYVYHAMYAYFDRDNVALKGLAKFFKESSEEERQHAEKLMEYQNKRGGKVKLQSMMMPLADYDHLEKGDALYAMELALSLEKLTNEKLLNLHRVADQNNDAQLTDFIESDFLVEQVESIKKISEYVAQLRRVGRGHGVWHFDQMLLADAVAA